MINVEEYLQKREIGYKLHEHEAVFTVEQAEKVCKNIPGLSCKNLFLRDKKSGTYFLVILPAHKRLDLKAFEKIIGSRVTFGDAADMKKLLGVEPGSVSPFGLIYDVDHNVTLYIDQDVVGADVVTFHPNVNTATLELTQAMFQKFLRGVEHTVHPLMAN